MILAKTRKLLAGAAAAAVIIALGSAYAQQGPRGKTSYIFPVDMEPFAALFAREHEDMPQQTHPSPKAVELFQRALAIQAAGATGKWEPEGRRLEYIDIDIALMRELGQGFWGVSVLDVQENADGPPAWERSPRNIESWHEAIRLRRALVDAVRDAPGVQSSANVQNEL